MKHQLAATVAPLLCGVLLAGLTHTSVAARERMTVEEGGITFKVNSFDDDRSNPYNVMFRAYDGAALSKFRFDAAGKVAKINVGTERYEVLYTSDGNLDKVQLRSSTRRALAEEMQFGADGPVHFPGATLEYRRRLYACSDCEKAWDKVCDVGVPTVCHLVGYDSPVLDATAASISMMCDTFGRVCSRYTSVEACAGQCVDDGDDDIVGVNACLDITSDDYRCSIGGSLNDSISFNDCGLVDADVPDVLACFESVGRINVEQLFMENNQLTTLPEDLLSGMQLLTVLSLRNNQLTSLAAGAFSDQFSFTYLDQLLLDNNQLTTLPEGVFDGLRGLFSLFLGGNPDLQCVPTVSVSELYLDSEDVQDGTCLCEPAEAVTCEEGSTCQPGTTGYTCE